MSSPESSPLPDRDALDLLRAFAAREVRYLLVGEHAHAYYGPPRATADLDLFIEPSPENAARIAVALADFGLPTGELDLALLAVPGALLQMGEPPWRIDLNTELTGITFAEGWAGHPTVRLADVDVPVIAWEALVKNKRATGRPKDLLDLALLGVPVGAASDLEVDSADPSLQG